MKKQHYIFIICSLIIIFGLVFYWWGLRPTFGKKECYKRAEMWRQYTVTAENALSERGLLTKRVDYEKVFQDNYDTCIMQKGLKE